MPYGYGMGCCCSLWLRQGDYHALRVLGHYLFTRLRRLARGLARRQSMLVQEEAIILTGVARGFLQGWRLARQERATFQPNQRITANQPVAGRT